MKLFLAGLNGRKNLVDEVIFSRTSPVARNGSIRSNPRGGGEMNIYLAGGINGNLKPEWIKAIQKITPDKLNLEAYMKVFCGGDSDKIKEYDWKNASVYVLESFYYADEWVEKHIPLFKDFLLDSGAFTFFSQKPKNINWEEYVDKYADFINRNNVKHFFELDIDALVGYENVLKLRKRLENKTGKQCIPVWHKTRGKEEYENMCREYSYVALGGLVGGGGAGGEYAKKYWQYFPYFIDTAHKNGAKIHALGFTSLEGITKYHFDSVDSTAWTAGNRFGYIYRFNGKTMEKFDKKAGQRLADSRAVALNNFIEWVKFQKYAEMCL